MTWDLTVYNVPQASRQTVNIIATMSNAVMDKGQSLNITTPLQTIGITNIDNAPVFDYDIPELKAPLADPKNGITKIQLQFEVPAENLKWTTDDCSAGNTIFSAGRESWACDFPCTIASAKEL